MEPNSSTTRLVIGLAAFGLGLVIAGVRLYRRRQAGEAPSKPQGDPQGGPDIENEELSHREELPEDRGVSGTTPSNASQEDRLQQFFVLVLVLSVPFWVFGGSKLPLPVNLPTGALVGFTPLIAALILSYRQHGSSGVKGLFKRVFDTNRIRNPMWYLPTLLLMPVVYYLSYVVMRAAGLPLPDPKIQFLLVPAYFLLYFFEAIGEELGWMGYAIDPMQNRWGALKASLMMGGMIAVWHTIPYIQTQNPPNWIVWQLLSEFPLRILYTWIYNNTGQSVFATILFHDMINISWSLFPNNGSHYDPFVTGLITGLTAAIVLFGWDAKTLARFRFAQANP